jgi:hypothetical protein
VLLEQLDHKGYNEYNDQLEIMVQTELIEKIEIE